MKDKILIIPRNSSVSKISKLLDTHGLIKHSLLFEFLASLYSKKVYLKSGEYCFYANISPIAILNMLSKGSAIRQKLVIPEGVTVEEILRTLNQEVRLLGKITEQIAEGSLMPNTYYFFYGQDKIALIKEMQKLMLLEINEAFKLLDSDSPLKSPIDILILASIIEKETNLDIEKPLIASVFLNRLKRKMKLQSDPTTIYAITLGKYKFSRSLTKQDLLIQSPYNTYHAFNLPPGPISCPGKKSISAVVQPAKTDYLFFVSNGNGGHVFSKSLTEHNKNVKVLHFKKEF